MDVHAAIGPAVAPAVTAAAHAGTSVTRAAAPPLAGECDCAGKLGRTWTAARAWANRESAKFWLNFLFWHARRQPWFARGAKPFFLWGVWNFSDHLYGGMMANARRILGDGATVAQCEALARQTIGNFFDFVCDVGLCLGQSRRQMLDRIESVEGAERYLAARTSGSTAGKGAIIVTAHMGSFEVGTAALLEHEKRRVHVLFHRDALGLFEQIRSTLRRRLGVVEVPVEQGWTVWMRLRDALRADGVVLIQGDRVMPGQKGRAMPFFGGHVLLPTGPVKLALASGAPMVPVFSVRTPEGNVRLFIEEPICVGEGEGMLSPDDAMAQLAAVLEKYVRRFPDQWLENRPAWVEDAGAPTDRPPGKRKIAHLKEKFFGKP
ncbi:MAG TPA: lysophospholipid acyltransferase family protein [Tepidisphaeraceae bacterium]|jgi:KDO2-lipid IV(A) lauroyltransferase|nr:lysophospholipid acyltransferase family protein [Tepidisphaeraceae bacterium]